LLLACCDKQILDLPIQDHMPLRGGELDTWVRLVIPTVKQGVIAVADPLLPDTNHTNHTITSLLAHATPDPLTTNELLVNESRPLPRMPHQISSMLSLLILWNWKLSLHLEACLEFKGHAGNVMVDVGTQHEEQKMCHAALFLNNQPDS
jgi:hypothetical protein